MIRFEGPPTSGKLAVAGRWEDAIVFAPGEHPPVASEEIAVEAFFGPAFFGVRRVGPPEQLQAFVQRFSDAMAADRLFEALPELPLGQVFQFAELGAEGAWLSVGALRIDDPCADFEELWDRVAAAPVCWDTTHDKALEFSYDNGDGTAHWFAVPVSRDQRVDRELLRAALADFCGS